MNKELDKLQTKLEKLEGKIYVKGDKVSQAMEDRAEHLGFEIEELLDLIAEEQAFYDKTQGIALEAKICASVLAF